MRKFRAAAVFCPFFYLLMLNVTPGRQAMAADGIDGRWVPPSGDAVIEISGIKVVSLHLIRVREPVTDIKNPNPTLRSRHLEGLQLGTGFTRDGNVWQGGTLYDPASGRTYKGRIRRLNAFEIELRGYVGVPAFGRGETWTRLDVFSHRMSRMLGQRDFCEVSDEESVIGREVQP